MNQCKAMEIAILEGSIIDRKQDDLSNIEEIDKSTGIIIASFIVNFLMFDILPSCSSSIIGRCSSVWTYVRTMERTRSFEKLIDLLQMHADLFKEGKSAKMNFEINDYPGSVGNDRYTSKPSDYESR
ncbi:hypothetical protein ZIOFF_028618 [Zingiber officinale]|uniref:Uncharacterized protein n=1 Tax=Zingiber officinale TaxID=94328 RepID=A0A8J5GSB8_ZINOF|nr:hypothetical protein ZIOFF_028618 [Zingiber officinale]